MARRVWADRHRVADRWHRAGMLARHLLRRGWSFLPGLLGLVLSEPAFEEGDSGEEVIVEGEEQVDVVEVLLAEGTIITHAKLTAIDPTRVFQYYPFPLF